MTPSPLSQQSHDTNIGGRPPNLWSTDLNRNVCHFHTISTHVLATSPAPQPFMKQLYPQWTCHPYLQVFVSASAGPSSLSKFRDLLIRLLGREQRIQ